MVGLMIEEKDLKLRMRHSILCSGYRGVDREFDETECDCGYIARLKSQEPIGHCRGVSSSVMPQKIVQDMISASKDMNRQKLIECLRWLAESHETLMEMHLSDETAGKAFGEIQSANHSTIREMAGDLRCLVAWVDSVVAGYEPHIEHGSSLFSICKKWRN